MSESTSMPAIADMLKAGVQFGHEAKRWNPKMRKYIYAEKNRIHIIDVTQTEKKLQEAVNFLKDAASRGSVLLVGTKRQASEIIRDAAVKSGAYFMTARWVGGLLTNFTTVKRSLNLLNSLEKQMEEGVEDRTKYEVALMKKEWARLFRLYGGVKSLNSRPTAVVVLDAMYEKAAVREARRMHIPVVGIVDTNADPEMVDYAIPANDDAVASINLLINTLADAVLAGNNGAGVKHNLKDFTKVEVKITKKEIAKEPVESLAILQESTPAKESVVIEQPKKAPSRSVKSKGILERVKEEAKTKPEKPKAKKEAKAEKVEPKKAAKVKPEEKPAKSAIKAKKSK